MLNAAELKDSISEEFRLIRHIATKIDPAHLDWRPSEKQRSTIELMRYLALCGIGPIKAMLAEDWSLVGNMAKELESLDYDGFDAAMQDEERAIHAELDALGDAGLTSKTGKLPWGTEMPLGQAIFTTSYRFLCAYRMQLFLYAKQSGTHELGTTNAWLGKDPQ